MHWWNWALLIGGIYLVIMFLVCAFLFGCNPDGDWDE